MNKKSSPKAKQQRVPKLRHCNGRGFVELCGQRHYLGPWGAAATKEAYDRKTAEWLVAGRRLPVSASEITVIELCDRFLDHAKTHYRRPDGAETTSMDAIREAIRVVKRLYGRSLVSEFGPKALRAVRQEWIARGLARSTVNSYTRTARQIFRWGVSIELVSPTVCTALEAVEGLKQGRSDARETEPIKPVSQAHIDAVKAVVSRQVAALIDLQLLTGARAGEIVNLRPCDMDTSGDVWTVNVARHKTEHLGKTRVLHLGPRAQALLRPLMLRPADAPMFSPREAEIERYAKAESHRRPDQKPDERKTDRRLGKVYSVAAFRRAIERACDEAEIEVWTPHQLRHTAATMIRKRFGLEAAQVVLGHAHADMTEQYAEQDMEKAAAVAREVG